MLHAKRLYNTREKLQLRPITDKLKTVRNDLVSRWFCRDVPADFAAFRNGLGDISDVPILLTVAFNLPWAIDLLIRSTRRHMAEWRLIVVDNSNKPEKRDEIRAVCERHGVPYYGLPRNPERSPNRSHGIALNWAWRNILKPAKVKIFGVIDHDCFPFRRNEQLERIRHRPVDGLRARPRFVVGAWYIWAGYCFFNMPLCGWRELDFNHDQSLRLDTAGRNWTTVYRHLDLETAEFLTSRGVPIPSADGTETWTTTAIGDSLIHVGGASYRSTSDRESVARAVRAHIEASL